jgi:hypothetical protein
MEVPKRTKKQNCLMILGLYPEECKSRYNKDTCTPMFSEAMLTIAKLQKQLICLKNDK